MTTKPYPRYGQMLKGYKYSKPITFEPKYGWLASGQFPANCIAECSASGQVAPAVEYWVKKLNFQVPREHAIKYLKEFGAWPLKSDAYDTGLEDMSDSDLAEKVLWLACGDIKEQGEWLGLVH